MSTETLKIVLLVSIYGSMALALCFFIFIGKRIDLKQKQEIQAAKRQAELSAFWMAEMQRLHPTPDNQRATITRETTSTTIARDR